MKFSKIFTRAIALLLMMTLLTGLVPESCITLTSAWMTALAEEQAASEAAQPVSDVLTSDSGWLYRICADGHAMLLGHADTSAAQLSLPTVVDGAWVVRIGENAFADNAALTEVFIPGSITEIASSAFSAQPSLNIRAWNGAGALAFAQKRGFGSTNLSEYDFFDDLIDLSELSSAQWSLETSSTLRVSGPMALRMKPDVKLYIPPCGTYESGLPATVRSVTQKDGYVLVTFSELGFAGAVESYEVHNAQLVPDLDNIVLLNEGVTLADSVVTRGDETAELTLPVTFDIDFKVKMGGTSFSVTGGYTFTPGYSMSLEYEWFELKHFSYSATNTHDTHITLKAEAAKETPLTPGTDAKLQKTQALMDSLLKKTKPAKEEPLAVIPLKSGLISVNVQLSLVLSLSGEVTIKSVVETSETFSVDKETGEKSHTKSKKVKQKDCSIAVNGAVECKLALVGTLGFSDTKFSMDFAELAISLKINFSATVHSDTPLCCDVSIDIIFKVTAQIGVLGGKGEKDSDVKIDLVFGGEIFTLKFNLWNKHYEGMEDKWTDKCTSDYCEVYFASYTSDKPDPVNVRSGYTVAEPTLAERRGYVLDGWYLDKPTYQQKWDFANDVVTQDIILHAKWTLTNPTPTPSATPSVTPDVTPTPTPQGTVTPEPDVTPEPSVGPTVDPDLDVPAYYMPTFPSTEETWEKLSKSYNSTNGYYWVTGFKDDSYKNATTALNIPASYNGIPVAINNYAFKNCTKLQYVKASCYIDKEAFAGCTNLQTAVLGGSATFGFNAFENCTSLSSIIWTGGTSKTRNYFYPPFNGCTGLKVMYLLGDINITGGFFYECTSLKAVISKGGFIQSLGEYAFANCYNLKEVPLGSELTEIPEHAFWNAESLTHIELPSSIKTIGGAAFAYCSLNSIVLPSSVETIGGSSFLGCTSLESVEFPVNSNLTIGHSAFKGCTALTEIDISHADIGEAAFGKTTSLKHVSIGSGTIGYEAFIEAANLTRLELGNGVTSIGARAFYEAKNLSEFFCNAEHLTSIGKSAFCKCSLTDLELHISCSDIGSSAFMGTGIKKLTVDNCSIVGSQAFTSCWRLKEATFNGDIVTYYSNACSPALRELTINGNVGSIVEGTYTNSYPTPSDLEKITIAGSVNEIKDSVFYGLKALKEVTIEGDIGSIGNRAFFGCSALEDFNAGGNQIGSIGNSAFEECTALKRFNLGDQLTTIGERAFYNCSLCEITDLPSTLDSIGEYAFYNCNALSGILTLSNSITTIAEYTFYNCKSIEGILASGVTSVGQFAFYGSNALNSVKLSNNLTSIANSAFSGCKSLTVFDFPDTLQSIGNYAFYCAGIPEFVISGSLTTLGASAFESNPALQRVEINANLSEIKESTFESCTALTEVVLPNSITLIDKYAFWNCNNLVYSSFPTALETIGEAAFFKTALEEVFLSSNVRTIGNKAFYQCNSLKMLSLPNGITTIGTEAFRLCAALEELVVPGSTTSIGQNAFRDSGLKYVEFEDGTGITIGRYAFYNCASLEKLILPEGLTSIESFTFEDCKSLSSLHLPSTLVNIGGSAFDGCKALQNLVIPNGVTTIGNSAFAGVQLKNIVLPRSVVSLGEYYAFSGCADLEYVVIPKEVTSLGVDSLPHKYRHSYYLITDRGSTAEQVFANDSYIQIIYLDEAQPVLFNAMGGSDVQTVYVEADSLVPVPEAPVRQEYEFTGWFTDEACTQPWNFASDTMPMIPLTLYAGWEYAPTAFVYQLSGGQATLTGYRGKDSAVVIPDTLGGCPVTAIAANVFYDDVRSVTIPASVQTIHPEAFRWADHLHEILVAEGSTAFASVDGVLYTANGTLVRYPAAKVAASFTPAEGTTTIGSYAFAYADSVGEVVLPEGVTIVQAYAFYHCDGLTTLAFSLSLTRLDACAVLACPNLRYVTFAAEPEMLGTGCFVGSHDELFILAPDGSEKLFALADLYHFACNEYAVVYISDGEVVGTSSARAGVILPEPSAPSKQKYRTFCGWSTTDDGELWNFETGVMPAEILTLYAVWVSDFTCETTEDGVTITEWNGADEDGICHIPSEIDGQPVTDIADGCIPTDGSVTISGDKGSAAESYANRTGLTFVPYMYTVRFETNGGTPVASQRVSANETLAAPETTKTGYTLSGWYANKALTRGWDFAENLTPARDLTLYAAWTANDDAQDVPFTFQAVADGLAITGYTGSESAASIPESINGIPVTEIAAGAFRNDETLFTLTVPGSVLRIGSAAFAGSRLDTVTFHEGTISIGSYAFEDCAELSSIVLADSISTIGEGAFQGCGALSEVTLPTSLKTLSRNCFAECSILMNVSLPAGLETIESGAFEGCAWLGSIALGANVSELNADAFSRCTRLAEITVHADNAWYAAQDGVLLSKDGAALILYPAGKAATDYTLPQTVTTIQAGAMAGSRIETLRLNEGLLSIQEGALMGSTSLASIVFAENGQLAEIRENAFSGCTALGALALPDSLLSIRSNAFALCRLTAVVIGQHTALDSDAIPAWNGLTIYGVSGSEAAYYAQVNSIRFVSETDVPVTSLTLDAETLTLSPGEIAQLTAALNPANTTETQVLWTSSDTTVAMVDENGGVTARSTGTTIITAQAANGSTAQCAVTVQKAAVAESIVLSASSLALEIGETTMLSALVLPAEATQTTQLVWSSSNEQVAICLSGRVIAIAEGTATITCTTANGLEACCTVAVGDVQPEDPEDPEDPENPEDPEDPENPEIPEIPEVIEPDLVLPAALKTIGEEAFAGGAFAAVAIPDGAETIGARAFANCPNLVQISVPDSVTSIAADAFAGCNAVLFVCSEGSAAQLYAESNGFVWVENQ